MKARLRQDLRDQELIPITFEGYENDIDWTQSYSCWQPDEFDGHEFNLILAHPEYGVICVNSIDFDFELDFIYETSGDDQTDFIIKHAANRGERE